eukprot:5018370-Amphidinium_carterae.3
MQHHAWEPSIRFFLLQRAIVASHLDNALRTSHELSFWGAQANMALAQVKLTSTDMRHHTDIKCYTIQ